ncbi:hypothetical protein [Candidatus Methanomethylophilus sp. 1R26]
MRVLPEMVAMLTSDPVREPDFWTSMVHVGLRSDGHCEVQV